MSDKIEPALSSKEWAKGTPGVYGWDDGSVFFDWREDAPSVDRPHAIIAALNAALPDSDPRKITREKIAALREVLDDKASGWSHNPELSQLADALESYLRPGP